MALREEFTDRFVMTDHNPDNYTYGERYTYADPYDILSWCERKIKAQKARYIKLINILIKKNKELDPPDTDEDIGYDQGYRDALHEILEAIHRERM